MSQLIRQPGTAAQEGVRIRIRRSDDRRHQAIANDRGVLATVAEPRSGSSLTGGSRPAADERRSGPQRLHRPVALVTGGAQGLGAAIVEELAAAGIAVVIADVQADRARQLAQVLDPMGDDVAFCPLDVVDPASVDAAMDVTLARFGRLDILVNNAGIDLTLPFDEITPEAFDRILGVNLHGPVNMCRAALPALRASGRGVIINIVSTAAKRAWPNASAYHASKWGLLGFSHALHSEARGYGVRVTAVICGGMRTPFILERFPDTPLENLQDPRSVAKTIRTIIESDHDSVIPELMILPMGETSWP